MKRGRPVGRPFEWRVASWVFAGVRSPRLLTRAPGTEAVGECGVRATGSPALAYARAYDGGEWRGRGSGDGHPRAC